jgi:hypothetical protein
MKYFVESKTGAAICSVHRGVKNTHKRFIGKRDIAEQWRILISSAQNLITKFNK